ncbi:MAG: ribosome-binding factor A, partial [Bdellovibrionales bacterium]|nr:ribosome-binding factor A [Bdellovibrionales bacterium]
TKAFESASGSFRNTIGKALELRRVPSLRFYYDDTLDTLEEVERLLQKTHQS